MRNMQRKSRIWGAALAMLALAAFAAAPARGAADGHFDRTLTVGGPVDLDVATGSGNIMIHSGDAGKVAVHATIHVSNGWLSGGDAASRVQYIEQHPPIEQNGNTIRIGHEQDSDLMRNISISYEITTPAQTNLHSSTGSGNQTVQGIGGPVDSTTGSGDLRFSEIGADVSARTGSGEVNVDDVHGSLRASTGSGNIHATGVAGGLHASTGSGDILLTQTGAGDVEVSTGSGTVDLSGVKGAVRVGAGSGNITARGTPTGNWSLHTGSGDLTVRLPQETSFDLYAHTSSGSINSKFPMTVQGEISPRNLHGKVGSGGPTVDLRTSSGTIQIETQ